MTRDEIKNAIYDVPAHADYAAESGELDPEDIDPARVAILKSVIARDIDDPDNDYLHFNAARVLCSWGYRCGFDMIVKYVFREDLMEGPGEISHRLYGYNTGYKFAYDAIWSYHSQLIATGLSEEESRKIIYLPIVKIIEYSNHKKFELSLLFRFLSGSKFGEYYPHIKRHLLSIIDNPEFHERKILQAIEFLNGVDPLFVASVLKARGKTIADYK